ncbi:phage tail sheath family protein [Pseudaestuariivita atlantica]|uniref:Tail sheath protein C-terminal domain-containing protein n=1 Tax=Pseudaestuariivita atlantica TaxID=1317121 RepID=A0A0L1JMU2_9RHOB|nr:phage tail sheath C-terminal domain-containing protein [Pseudaestuariivita atlantica]KNG93069.1 hypothetical protein ATO11_14225 [Pseudaestuariivita atlantica]
MAQEKTPGVYINEINAFPNSVVEVATAVPVFLGFTQTARRGSVDLTNEPTRVTSLAEYTLLFGGPKQPDVGVAFDGDKITATPATASRFLMYDALRLFFGNGGGACYIMSVGSYDTTGRGPGNYDAAWQILRKEQEPTMIVVPDAVTMSEADHYALSNTALAEAATSMKRVAILDIHGGAKRRDAAGNDVIETFRTNVTNDDMSYGAAYYPWVNTTVTEAADVDYSWIADGDMANVISFLKTQLAKQTGLDIDDPKLAGVVTKIDELANPPADPLDRRRLHQALLAVSAAYKELMASVLSAVNLLPPSGAMAGVYARTDTNFGVFKAPANTGVQMVVSPSVSISHEEQEDLNVPLDGKAINAIRTFIGRGVLVWGARTLDGNSQDWRYVPVRRTLIMLEQSIKLAAEAYVFQPNDAGTWMAMKTMIENFLNNQWKAGALAGATPAEAYSVSVGLGSTMTGNDILDGYMRVTVRVAVTRPAEFIVITFQQKMQTS